MLPHILSVWIRISFEQFHPDKSLLKLAPPHKVEPFLYLFLVILVGEIVGALSDMLSCACKYKHFIIDCTEAWWARRGSTCCLAGEGVGLGRGHGARARVEEHTLNLMPKAPSFYNFFVQADSHTHTLTRALTCALLLKHKTQKPGCWNNDCVLGRKVIGLHLGAWEEVRCTVYLLCLSILIWEGENVISHCML